MISLLLYDEKYIALASDFRHKDAIKALAPYPDVKWSATDKLWLVDAELLPAVLHYLAGDLAPLTLDFIFGYPIPQPRPPAKRAPRRRNRKEERAQLEDAQRAGRMLVEYGMETRRDKAQ